MGEFPAFEGGDKAIADEVRREVTIASGEVIEIDSDDDDDDDDDDDSAAALITPRTDLLHLCQQLEVGCNVMQYGDPQFSLNLLSQLRVFRAQLRREELLNARQTSLERLPRHNQQIL
ncbi:hypothetical protein BDR04DRAFT_1090855 [Suillus decipiens]|nr:hypothetical protein BDR04DRAFT_1090855 [Suillus decipiens]